MHLNPPPTRALTQKKYAQVIWYLISDSKALREQAQQRFGDKVWTQTHEVKHMSCGKFDHCDHWNQTSTIAEAAADMLSLAQADALVLTQKSGFGKVAAWTRIDKWHHIWWPGTFCCGCFCVDGRVEAYLMYIHTHAPHPTYTDHNRQAHRQGLDAQHGPEADRAPAPQVHGQQLRQDRGHGRRVVGHLIVMGLGGCRAYVKLDWQAGRQAGGQICICLSNGLTLGWVGDLPGLRRLTLGREWRADTEGDERALRGEICIDCVLIDQRERGSRRAPVDPRVLGDAERRPRWVVGKRQELTPTE